MTERLSVQSEALAAAREIGAELGRFAGVTGISLRDVEEAMRAEFVLAASERLERDEMPVTPGRVAAATGLPRSIVERALAVGSAGEARRSAESLNEDGFFSGLELLCSLWGTDSRFTAVYGVPRDLQVRRVAGVTDTLEDLAALALPGVPFDRVLSALRDQGLIQLTDERSRARLTGHAVGVSHREARAIARYGRLVSGLMRTLRVNYDETTDPATAKPWELTLTSDRPIAREHIDTFIELVDRAATAWLSSLEVDQRGFSVPEGKVGSRYAVCCYVSEAETARIPRGHHFLNRDAFDLRAPLMRSIVTAHRLDPESYVRFRREVSSGCDAWFLRLDAEQKQLFAPPGEPGVVLRVTCFLFPITGTEGPTDEKSDIDLVEAVVPRAARL